jgi:glycosyltransferase involved in cell wall biosynthesis
MKYTALIRTYDSFPLVAEVVAALRAQATPPEKIIAVDSHSCPEQRVAMAEIFDEIIDYPNEPFNYSKAINIGIEACETEYVLIISSHVVLKDKYLISYGINHIKSATGICLGCCFNPGGDTEKTYGVTRVDKHNFSLLLGLSNSCAFLKKQYILDRPFREEVFSAEDQEWAAYYLRNHDASFYSFHSIYVNYLNPHVNELKTLNEFVSMAYYTHKELRGPKYILPRLARALLAFVRNRPNRARMHFTIAMELFLTNFRKPVKLSAYYGREVTEREPEELVKPHKNKTPVLKDPALSALLQKGIGQGVRYPPA